jgi:aspartyl-tRNA(Asn)/glutamyl-tRNA(Gln) amidotransferase subunit B
MQWQVVIGLEVHVQLATKSKIFSNSSASFGAPPNTQANIVDLGLPGVLPVLNKEVVKMAVKLGLAIGGTINKKSIFARKNYFYPDLPKGYQITQDKFPIITGGRLDIEIGDNIKKVSITRAHLEEDAGKSIHDNDTNMSYIDLNRAGVPLIEIVSEPDLRSAKEAVAYLKTLHRLVRYIGICTGNMQEGAFRCDANISVRRTESEPYGTRVEIKNINSFKFVEKAIDYEIERQIDKLQHHEPIVQETRLYDSAANVTRPMREKENADDYRYFPDPDLPPLVLSDKYIALISEKMEELPDQKFKRFMKQYDLPEYEAKILTMDLDRANYFEKVFEYEQDLQAKLLANTIIVDLLGALNKENLEIRHSPISEELLAGLILRIQDGTISNKIGKVIFEDIWNKSGTTDEIIEKKNLKQIINPNELISLIENVLTENPEQLADYLAGREKLFGFFIGQIMKISQGKANPTQLNKLLLEKLDLLNKNKQVKTDRDE